MKHNNIIQNSHFHKDWQRQVRTWFNQPGRKQRRRRARQEKAARVAPRPVEGALRPAVRCPTAKYNIRVRAGRGFTLEELKEAGVSPKFAQTIGIAVDHRRRNRSQQSLQENAQRLKAYMSKLILFPRKTKAPKKGDASAAEIATAQQLKGAVLPIEKKEAEIEVRKVTKDDLAQSAYKALRTAKSEARNYGKMLKREEEKRKAADEAKKMK